MIKDRQGLQEVCTIKSPIAGDLKLQRVSDDIVGGVAELDGQAICDRPIAVGSDILGGGEA